MDHLLPPHIAVNLVDAELPWDRATQFQGSEFLQNYTLHDSNWLGMHFDCGWSDTVVAVISIDPVWNRTIAVPTALVMECPFLFLRFDSVSSLQMNGFSDIGGLQRGISSASVDRPSEEECITTITDHYGASIQIRHFSIIHGLLLSPDGDPMPLPAAPPAADMPT